MDGPKDRTGLEPEEVCIEEIQHEGSQAGSCHVAKAVSISNF